MPTTQPLENLLVTGKQFITPQAERALIVGDRLRKPIGPEAISGLTNAQAGQKRLRMSGDRGRWPNEARGTVSGTAGLKERPKP